MALSSRARQLRLPKADKRGDPIDTGPESEDVVDPLGREECPRAGALGVGVDAITTAGQSAKWYALPTSVLYRLDSGPLHDIVNGLSRDAQSTPGGMCQRNRARNLRSDDAAHGNVAGSPELFDSRRVRDRGPGPAAHQTYDRRHRLLLVRDVQRAMRHEGNIIDDPAGVKAARGHNELKPCHLVKSDGRRHTSRCAPFFKQQQRFAHQRRVIDVRQLVGAGHDSEVDQRCFEAADVLET
jgi:hypothetical protein